MKQRFQELATRLDLKVDVFQMNGRTFKVWREGSGESRGTLAEFAEEIVKQCAALAAINDDAEGAILEYFDMKKPDA